MKFFLHTAVYIKLINFPPESVNYCDCYVHMGSYNQHFLSKTCNKRRTELPDFFLSVFVKIICQDTLCLCVWLLNWLPTIWWRSVWLWPHHHQPSTQPGLRVDYLVKLPKLTKLLVLSIVITNHNCHQVQCILIWERSPHGSISC